MIRITISFLSAFLLVFTGFAQSKITLEDLWLYYKYYPESVDEVHWMKDGKHYLSLELNRKGAYTSLVKSDITTGKAVETLVDGSKLPDSLAMFRAYALSPKENKVLLSAEVEPIYRHSSKAWNVVYDLGTGKWQLLSKAGKQSNPLFSPDGSKVAFVRENNLYFLDLETGKEQAITKDGTSGELIHGMADWVYEEEFSFTRAFDWSPDSKRLAWISFDESKVPEYHMQVWGDGLYPEDYAFKYPKAGEQNSAVWVSMYDVEAQQSKVVLDERANDIYLPRLEWTKRNELLSVQRLNRLQNQLELLHISPDGTAQVVWKDKSKTYIEVTNDLRYLDNANEFVMSSESSGFKHLYHYRMDGKLLGQITKGDWEVDAFLGVDEQKGLVYYTSTEVSPLERQLYSIKLNGKKKTQLTKESGGHNIEMSPDFGYYLDYHSSLNTVPVVWLRHTSESQKDKLLVDNASLKKRLEGLSLGKASFFKFKTSDGVELNGWQIVPPNFDPFKTYPVLMDVYGGPGRQTVQDTWGSFNYIWYQMLAQQGYIVVSVDGRGTGGRGAKFRSQTYGKLGELETKDQIETAKFLAKESYVDADRIGIWGWSFGGYLTSLCMTKGDGLFKMGIAVAPVTNWRFYDNIYSERYLGLPQDNPKGYDENSPVNFAEDLQGNYLLIHGTADDNVHLQNAIHMQNALISAGKQFDTFYYPDRNHGIYGGVTRYHLYKMMTDFILEKL